METLKATFAGRPAWMNLLFVFCGYMTFVYMPYDMFVKPVERDQEVWFGLLLTGWAAKLTEPIHWFIYGAGFYGFLRRRTWLWPWASLYAGQVAIGMFVWALTDPRGGGILSGSIAGAAFLVLAIMLWRAKDRFGPMVSGQQPEQTENGES
ncbi:MAG: hypothetical protein KDI19_10430 [Pseudomonadales bacterium]|nr:hypothetical protein [Pseudomonadales bacterium]